MSRRGTSTHVQQPDRPRPIAFLIAQAVLPTQSQSINIIEVVAGIGTWQFPNQLPPLAVVTVLVGGRPGTIYTTRWRLVGPDGAVMHEKPGADIPFTTEIKRVNAWIPLRDITDAAIVTGPGTHRVELLVNGESIGGTDLDVVRVNPPMGIGQQP